jgi:hypothetical protein
MTITVSAERATGHCFQCRERRDWERILGSRRVFRCLGGCGNTKEFTQSESEQPAVPVRAQPVESSAPKSSHEAYHKRTAAPKKAAPQEKRTMPDLKRSPLQSAIDAAVERAVQPLKEKLDALTKQLDELGDGMTGKDLDRKLDEKFEGTVPDLVNRALLQMLATPKGAEVRAKTKVVKRPRNPACTHRGSCGKDCFK